MAHSDDWNAAFEALPTNDNYGYELDNYLRTVWRAVRERMEIDHYWKATSSQADDGKHKKITLPVLAAAPTEIASGGIIYTKDVSTKAELFYVDEDGDEVQLTSGGATAVIPAGTKMLFYADAAPTGWTIQNTLDDKVVFVTKGAAAGGETGGEAHSTGTWTQPDCSLDETEMPPHVHVGRVSTLGSGIIAPGWQGSQDEGAYGVSRYPDSASAGGTDGTVVAHHHGEAWRPASYNFIICAKAA